MQYQMKIRVCLSDLIQLRGKFNQWPAFVFLIHKIDANQKIMNMIRVEDILDMIVDIQ